MASGGRAERLALLLDASSGLLCRAGTARRSLLSADSSSLLPDKLAKKLLERFPEDSRATDSFSRDPSRALSAFSSWYGALQQWVELREHSLNLLTQLSRELATLAFELSQSVLVGYLELAVSHVQLQLLLGSVLTGTEAKGRLAAAVYAHAHRVLHRVPPPEWDAVARIVLELATPVTALQKDFGKVQLRVADILVPFAPRIRAVTELTHLRDEAFFAPPQPAAAAVAAAPAAAASSVSASPSFSRPPAAHTESEERLLPLAWRAQYWVVYGFLAAPEELAVPGATELLCSVLSRTHALSVHAEVVLHPHCHFDVDPKMVAKWLTGRTELSWRTSGAGPAPAASKDEPKRFIAALREAKTAAHRMAPVARASARTVLANKLDTLAAMARHRTGSGQTGGGAGERDSPPISFELVISALRVANAELAWWALHRESPFDEVCGLFRGGSAADRPPMLVYSTCPARAQRVLSLAHAPRVPTVRPSRRLAGAAPPASPIPHPTPPPGSPGEQKGTRGADGPAPL